MLQRVEYLLLEILTYIQYSLLPLIIVSVVYMFVAVELRNVILQIMLEQICRPTSLDWFYACWRSLAMPPPMVFRLRIRSAPKALVWRHFRIYRVFRLFVDLIVSLYCKRQVKEKILKWLEKNLK